MIWLLVIGHYLVLGAWCLVFSGMPLFPVSPQKEQELEALMRKLGVSERDLEERLDRKSTRLNSSH